MVPKVDTFEHDIADEIKKKEASLAEISSASNNVGNDPVDLPKKTPVFLIALISSFVISLFGLIGIIYFYFTDSLLPPSSQEQIIEKKDIPKNITTLEKISPTLFNNIGRFVTSVEQKNEGYIIMISDYPNVLAYMIHNEKDYKDELLELFSKNKNIIEVSSTTLPKINQDTKSSTNTSSSSPNITESTFGSLKKEVNSTTTKENISLSSTTKIEQNTEETGLPNSLFKDTTQANQNMRIYKDETNSLIYAFIDTKAVVISNTKERILSLKGYIKTK